MTPLHWLVCLSVFLASPALAQKVCDPEDPKSCVQALIQGETVPFDGQLMTPRRAAKLAVLANGCQDRVALCREEEQALSATKLAGEEALRKSDELSCTMQKETLMKRMQGLEELLTPKWYERPAFVAIVASTVTVALLVVSVKAVQVLK